MNSPWINESFQVAGKQFDWSLSLSKSLSMAFRKVGVVLFVDLQNDRRFCATDKLTADFYDNGTGSSE